MIGIIGDLADDIEPTAGGGCAVTIAAASIKGSTETLRKSTQNTY
jgi:hypothetical protein